MAEVILSIRVEQFKFLVLYCISVAYSGILFGGGGGIHQIQMRTEDRDFGAVAP